MENNTPQTTTDTTTNAPASLAEQLLAERKAFESALTLRAWNDPAFAEQLQQDPVATINAAFGIELPADLAVQVHHETPTTLHLALPPAPMASDAELTTDDLERVSGGGLGTAFVVSGSAIVTAGIASIGTASASAGFAASVSVTASVTAAKIITDR